MKLLRAVVRNYRVHREVAVEFGPTVTVIAAPNEFGKSTLLEAIHRALFLKHRTGGQIRAGMGSRHGGHPEVELHFSAAGSQWRLRKVFAGSSGSCELTDTSAAKTWKADEAEQRLAQLTGREAIGANQKELDAAWDHLWVWQGTADADPLKSESAGELQRALDARSGDAASAALAGADAALSAALQQIVDATWTKTRKDLKSDSEAKRLEATCTLAKAALEQAETQKQQRRELVDNLNEIRRELARQKPEFAAIEPELSTLQQEVRRLEAIETEVRGSRDQLGREQQALTALEREVAVIASNRQLHAAAGSKLRELRHAEQTLADGRDRERERAAAARTRIGEAEVRRERARDHAQFVRLCLEIGEKETRLRELEIEAETFAVLQRDSEHAQRALDEAVVVRDDDLARFADLDRSERSARDRLLGASVRIVRTSGSSPMTIDGAPFLNGQPVHAANVVELRHEDGTVVQVQPGGEDLDALRTAAAATRDALLDALRGKGIANLEDARERGRNYAELAEAVRTKRALFQAARNPIEDRKRLPGELQGLRARADELRSKGLEANGDAMALDAVVRDQDAEIAMLRALAAKHDEEVRSKDAAGSSMRLQVETEVRAETQLATAIDEAERRLGDADARAQLVAATKATLATLTRTIEQAAPAIEGLPLLRGKREVLQKSRDSLHSSILELGGRASQLAEQLQGDHGEDLDAAIEERTSRLARAQQMAVNARARAEGDKLLLTVMEGLQRERQSRREAPFLKACADYLALAHGPGIRLGLDGETDRTLGLVDRTSQGLGAFAFRDLSHGGQELTALAVRLAMAEVLAAEQADRCVPLVLDDAVTNVDPERLRQVGFLLAHAATRGVQVVFALCDVERASWLRAERMVRLQRPEWGTSAPIAVGGDGE